MVILPHLLPEDAAPEPKRWTAEDFARFDREGLLGGEGDRFELLDGEILKKLGQNQPHIVSLRLAAQALRVAFGQGFDVSQQVPLRLGPLDVPEPDVTVLNGTARDFDGREPVAKDVALVVEIADSRLDTARGRKLEIYAHHGIAEYLIVNLRERTLEVRRHPRQAQGDWAEVHICAEDETISPLGAAEASVRVSDLLPMAQG